MEICSTPNPGSRVKVQISIRNHAELQTTCVALAARSAGIDCTRERRGGGSVVRREHRGGVFAGSR